MQLAFDRLYSQASSRDKCTLYSDRNLIKRRNVKAKVDSAVKPAHSFFDLCLKARVVAAALEIMNLESLDDTSEAVPKADASKVAKKRYLEELAGQIVNDYVVNTARNLELVNRIVGEQSQNQSAESEDSNQCDDMLSYQKALMEYALLLLNFKDAISEGDGDRILRCWKFFLPHLRNDKHSTKYSPKALYLMFQVYALLSPKAAHELIWNRSAKSRNGIGGNIPLDLLLEFFNRLLKDAVKKLGPNASQKSIDRICKSITITKELMDKFDAELHIHKRSGRHVVKSSDEDLKKVVKDLVDHKAMRHIPGRVYHQYHGMKPSFLWNFDIQNMHKWINDHKKYRYIEIKRRAR